MIHDCPWEMSRRMAACPLEDTLYYNPCYNFVFPWGMTIHQLIVVVVVVSVEIGHTGIVEARSVDQHTAS